MQNRMEDIEKNQDSYATDNNMKHNETKLNYKQEINTLKEDVFTRMNKEIE